MTLRTQLFRGLLALALVAPACAARDLGTAASPRPTTVDGAKPNDASPSAAAASPRAGGPPPTRRPSGGAQSSGEEPPGAEQPPAPGPRDDGAVGENATVYLRASIPKLVIEVDAVSRQEPNAQGLSHLRTMLASVVSKPAGIDVRPTETFAATSPGYTNAELQALIDAHRGTHTSPDVASLYVLYVNGSYEEKGGENTLAIAFDASNIVVFKDQVRQAETPLVSSVGIERSVLAHEAGHLLGLVNIGYTSPRPHEDLPDHPKHSKNHNSVMYWAVEFVNVAQLIQGRTSPPDDYDRDDRADLEDRKAGRL